MFLEVDKGHNQNDKDAYVKKNYPDQSENYKMKVIWSINFKHIIEINQFNSSSSKYSLAAANTLELRYVKNH